ncbi:MAG: tail fiber domain-containing protein, partial [Opitutaceae bacterium]
ARVTAVSAVASRASSLEAAVTDPATGLSAKTARIAAEEQARATAVEAVASRTSSLEATINSPTSGVSAAHSRISSEEQARVTAVDAVAARTASLETTVNSATTGLAATRARILSEEETRAAETAAVATRASALEATVNNASTGVAAAHSRITAEEGARASAVEAVANRASALESAVNNASSGLSATYSRIAAEETARSAADSALAGQINSVSATANSRNRTFFQSGSPTATAAGDLWIDLLNGSAVKRWDGTDWVDTTIANGAINSAVLSETNARVTALNAISDRTTVLESTINNSNTGLSAVRARVQTIEGAYVTQSYADAKKAEAITAAAADAAARVNEEATARSAADTAISTQIGTVAASIDGKNRTFLQATAPTGSSAGDLWIDTGNGNAVKRWNGSAWVDTTVASGAIGTAVSAEATARATADGNLSGKYSLKVAAGNIVTGMNITSATGAGADVSDITFQASSFKIHNGTSAVAPFQVVDGKVRVTGSLVLTSGDVSGLGSLATQNAVTAGQVSGLGSLATQNSVASSQVAGLGSLATASSVDLSTQVTNKSLANLDTSANTKLAGIAAHADVTLTAINGGLVITSGGLTLDGVPAIKSADYAAGSAGWAIKGNGDVEFFDGIFRGTVRAAVIDYAPLIGAGGPGLSAVMDWQHTGGENWRTDINDSNSAFRIFNSNATSGTKTIELGVGSRQLDRVKVWGDLEMTGYGYGDFTSYSSRTLKENISPVGGVLSRLMQVRVVEFDWKNGAPRAGRDVGVIAEEIEEIFPLVVVRDRAGIPAVNYPKLCVYLLRALQELGAARNEALEARP